MQLCVLADALKHATLTVALETLDLSANLLSGEDGKKLVAEILHATPNLSTLIVDLGGRQGEAATERLDRAATALDLRNRQLAAADAYVVAAWIVHCKSTLASVLLSSNERLTNDSIIDSLGPDKSIKNMPNPSSAADHYKPQAPPPRRPPTKLSPIPDSEPPRPEL